MAFRQVLKFPDQRLREVSRPIAEVTDEVRALASDLLDLIYDEPGIGLAAPQVGEAIRLVVVDTQWTEEGTEPDPLVLVNPEIQEPEGKLAWKEGCLSVPSFEAEVERAERVRLCARDLEGQEIAIDATGLLAVCLQHEVDHLDGILFIDRISRLKRNLHAQKPKQQLRRELEEAGVPTPV